MSIGDKEDLESSIRAWKLSQDQHLKNGTCACVILGMISVGSMPPTVHGSSSALLKIATCENEP